ncbi:MAG: hypothetical protein WBA83_17675 [Burkholderiaceae bacterium]
MKMKSTKITERRLHWSPTRQEFSAREDKGQHRSRRFIKGPIPLDWISEAACLPGKTLHVALALQYLAGLTKSNTIKLPAKTLDVMGVARNAKADALVRLQRAGLIAVRQLPGRAPVVTLLVAPEHSSEGEVCHGG